MVGLRIGSQIKLFQALPNVTTMQRSPSQQQNKVRIIAGEYRSRKLEFPGLEGLRPTSDRIRETLFNWLQDSIPGEACLDLFAGSGALGLEALSRGAARVDFIEKNTLAANAIRNNIDRLGANHGTVYCADALQWLDQNAQSADRYGLIFLDPPFREQLLAATITKLETTTILKEGCLVYIEKQEQTIVDEMPDNWTEIKNKKTGSVRYSLYQVATEEGSQIDYKI